MQRAYRDDMQCPHCGSNSMAAPDLSGRGYSGKLNRLARRTKIYSKTDGMLILSIALMWLMLVWI